MPKLDVAAGVGGELPQARLVPEQRHDPLRDDIATRLLVRKHEQGRIGLLVGEILISSQSRPGLMANVAALSASERDLCESS